MNTQQHQAPLGRPPKQEARHTRERILDTALDLFAAQGYVGTSVRRIARAVGVSESVIYVHFENKQAIYQELMAIGGPDVILELFDSLSNEQKDAEPAVFLRQFTDRVMAAWDAPRARRLLSVLIREGTLNAADERISLVAAITQVQHRLRDTFQRWMDANAIRSDLSPEQLVWEWFGPLNVVRLLYLHGQATEAERLAGQRVAAQHLDFFLAALLSRWPFERTMGAGEHMRS